MDYASIQIQDYGGNWLTFQRISFVEMTGDQSRLLRIYDRVCWKQSITDVGTVTGTAWSGVTISWDDGDTAHDEAD